MCWLLPGLVPRQQLPHSLIRCMNLHVTFKATDAHSSGALLLHLSIVLHQLRIDPVSIGMENVIDTPRLDTWRFVIREDARVKEFTEALKIAAGVRSIVVERPPTGGLEPRPAHEATD